MLSKKITIYFSILLLLSFVILPCSAVRADEETENTVSGKTMTLSGNLDNIVDIPDSVTYLILDGCMQSSDGEINCEGNVEVEIKAGTENTVGILTGYGIIRYTGGGTLNASTLLGMGDMMVFDHTGTISIENGTILSTGGSIYLNSGTIQVNAVKKESFGVFATAGSIEMNGGTVVSEGYAAGVYAYDSISLSGGSITSEASVGAAYSAGNKNGGSLTMSDAMQESAGAHAGETKASDGTIVYSVLNKNDKTLKSVSMEGPADTSRITEVDALFQKNMTSESDISDDSSETEEDDADTETSETETQKSDNSELSKHNTLIILISIILAVGIAALLAGFAARQGKHKKKK